MTFLTAVRLFHCLVVRHAARHKWLAGLNVVSIALGVSVYLAIQIANHSANRSLQASVSSVSGKASLEIRGEMDDTIFPRIKQVRGVVAAAPLVEGLVLLPDFPGEYLRVLGVDIFSQLPFATFQIGENKASHFDLEHWLSAPNNLAISSDFAKKYHIAPGQTLNVLVNSRTERLQVGSIIESDATMQGSGARIAAMDIAAAQELFGAGKISEVQILTKPSEENDVARRLREIVPVTTTVAPPAQRNQQVSQMLQAFQLNLSALSLVSLLVGMFLVFNTVSASVVRRRHEIGILRSGGFSRFQIRALFLGEALFYGVIGLVVGSIGGILLSNVLVGAVGKTISSLYVILSIDRIFIAPEQLIFTIVVGLGSVFTAAWLPANDAANITPVAALNPGYELDRSQRLNRFLPIWGIGLILLSSVVCAFSLQFWPWLGFAGAFFLLTGCSLFAPWLTLHFSRLAQHFGGSFLVVSLAAQNLRKSLARVSLTVAALGSAVAMMIGISVMIFSFRETIDTWIQRSLIADVFIAPASNETIGLVAFMPDTARTWLSERPEVRSVDTFRELRLPFRNENVRMSVVQGSRRDNLRFLGGNNGERNRRLFQPGFVLVSEPFARRFRLRSGDSISLPTPQGMRSFELGGVYFDYTSDAGNILMSRENFDPLWNDLRVHSLAVYLRTPADFESLTDAFRRHFGEKDHFSIYSNSLIRQRIFEIFDQTFAVTNILRVIAVGVAVMGIFLTLSTLVMERIRELAVLRSTGASRSQVCQIILWEGAMVGLLASVLGILTGCGLALILTFVVNKAFFGWTIQLAWPWLSLWLTPFWIVPVSFIGGFIPAWRASRLQLTQALRDV